MLPFINIHVLLSCHLRYNTVEWLHLHFFKTHMCLFKWLELCYLATNSYKFGIKLKSLRLVCMVNICMLQCNRPTEYSLWSELVLNRDIYTAGWSIQHHFLFFFKSLKYKSVLNLLEETGNSTVTGAWNWLVLKSSISFVDVPSYFGLILKVAPFKSPHFYSMWMCIETIMQYLKKVKFCEMQSRPHSVLLNQPSIFRLLYIDNEWIYAEFAF